MWYTLLFGMSLGVAFLTALASPAFLGAVLFVATMGGRWAVLSLSIAFAAGRSVAMLAVLLDVVIRRSRPDVAVPRFAAQAGWITIWEVGLLGVLMTAALDV